MSDVTLGGRTYRTGRLSPLKQLHVARRLVPLIPGMASIMDLASAETLDMASLLSKLGDLQPFMDAIAGLPDAEVDYVINTCLSVVHRQEGAGWAPVMSGNLMALQDISMPDMLQLAFAVVQENLLSFFGEPLLNSGVVAPLRAVPR